MMGSISLGTAREIGSMRVPRPAAGMIAFVTFFIRSSVWGSRPWANEPKIH